MAEEKKMQTNYSHSGSKELLQKILNDPDYTIKRWNASRKEYDIISPYKVYRTLLKKMIVDAKCPSKTEVDIVDDMPVKVFDELVEIIPELVAAHLDNDMKFKLPTQPDSNGTIYRKYVPAGSKVSAVRNIKENKVDGEVRSDWTEHYVIKCASKRPKDVTTKTRLK